MESTTFQKQYPLALIALGAHMAQHQLPVPSSVEVIDEHHDGTIEPALRLWLPPYADQQQKWLDSVSVDAEESEERDYGFRMAWLVRLPETGIRFTLTGLRSHTVWAPRVVSA